MYSLSKFPSQISLSLPSEFLRTLVTLSIICPFIHFSYTNRSLLQPNFQLCLSLLVLSPWSIRSLTKLSLQVDILNSLGYSSFNTISSTHLSSQNLIHFSSPNIHLVLQSNQLPCAPLPQILHISFYHKGCFLLTNALSIFLQEPYLASKISLHNPPSVVSYLHFHLDNRESLKQPMSLMPKPPTSIGLHIFFQFESHTQWST